MVRCFFRLFLFLLCWLYVKNKIDLLVFYHFIRLYWHVLKIVHVYPCFLKLTCKSIKTYRDTTNSLFPSDHSNLSTQTWFLLLVK